jgi:signal transduction histidine kinase
MNWTDLLTLGIGLGIGSTVGGWLRGAVNRKDRVLSALSRDETDAVLDQATQGDTQDDGALQQPLHDQLQQAQLAYQMATEMAQFKAGFLARTSHELRSPINSVISLHQLILSDLCDDPAEERQFVAQAYDSAKKMLALLDELISVSKAVYGTEQLELQPLQLQDLLIHVQHLTHLQAKNRNLRLNIELPQPDLYVLADPRWLQYVLVSLIDTPISLMQEGTIRLSTQVAPELQRVQILIEDQRPAEFWSEPLDLLDRLNHDGKADLLLAERSRTPGLTLLVNQALLELMGAKLEVLATPSIDDIDPGNRYTRLQCSILLALSDADTPFE